MATIHRYVLKSSKNDHAKREKITGFRKFSYNLRRNFIEKKVAA